MSARIGAALRRELPALDELHAGEPTLEGAAAEELALRSPVAWPPREAVVGTGAPRGVLSRGVLSRGVLHGGVLHGGVLHGGVSSDVASAPTPPSAHALDSLRALTSRLAAPGALAAWGEAGDRVVAMCHAVDQLLEWDQSLERERRAGARA